MFLLRLLDVSTRIPLDPRRPPKSNGVSLASQQSSGFQPTFNDVTSLSRARVSATSGAIRACLAWRSVLAAPLAPSRGTCDEMQGGGAWAMGIKFDVEMKREYR